MRKIRIAWFTTGTGDLIGIIIRKIKGQETRAWIGTSAAPGQCTDEQDAEHIMKTGAKFNLEIAEFIMEHLDTGIDVINLEM